jgi:hypothetical protein
MDTIFFPVARIDDAGMTANGLKTALTGSPIPATASDYRSLITYHFSFSYGLGRGAGVGRGLGVGVHLPVQRVGVGDGVGVAVGVGDAVAVGDGGGPVCAQYLPPLLPFSGYRTPPPQTIISSLVHTAV